MRVQATETTPTYSMGKNKKHKIRKTKEASDSSDDGSGWYMYMVIMTLSID